jgi:predicted GNAT family acetyltransferase
MSEVRQADLSHSEVRHNEARHRFEAGSESHPAHLDYRLRDGVAEMFHTEVAPEYQGRGIASKLAVAALTWARESGYKVNPRCSFVKRFIARNPEFADLV